MSVSGRAETAVTQMVYTPGKTIHLRAHLGDAERMLPVICQGVQNPGHSLIVQWTEEAASAGPLPAIGQAVQFYAMNAGVLHVAKGQIIHMAEGRLPRIRSRTTASCIAVPLRRYPRYRVLGMLRLGAADDPQACRQPEPTVMDLSRGGLGTTVSELALEVGAVVEFQLEAWVARGGEPQLDIPPLELHGRAEIRRCSQGETRDALELGLRFYELSEQQDHSIEVWLAAHAAQLREI